MWLKIKNAGEVEMGAFRLIGACTKRNDEDAIGYFGSGLKYAMATFLRENIEFKIFSGINEIKIHVESEMFREQAFNVIHINDVKTNFTTDMGPKWKTWQAIREIYCNALDEKDWSWDQVEKPKGWIGETNFYIKICDKVQEIVNNWPKYFCEERQIHWKNDYGEVYHLYNENTCLYRKGIRAYDDSMNSLFDYNIFKIDINESRVIESNYELRWRIAQIWSHPSQFMLKKLLETAMIDNSIEKMLEWRFDTSFFDPSDIWKEFLKGYILVPYSFAGHYLKRIGSRSYYKLPKEWIKKLVDKFGDEIQTAMGMSDYRFVEIPMEEREKFLIKQVMEFFREVKININYPIKYGDFINKDTLGMAVKETIILSPRCMNLGKKQIATTILEEAMHIDSLADDETRDFQSYILNQLITCLENMYGIFL